MSDEIYLEPCPFCGGRAEIIDALEAGPQAYVVCCRGCMASSRVIYAIKDDVTFDLSSAWNTRADTAAAQVAAAYERAADLCVDQFQAHLDLVITGNLDNARNRESAANMAEKLSHEIRALATDTQTDALEQVRREAERAGYERGVREALSRMLPNFDEDSRAKIIEAAYRNYKQMQRGVRGQIITEWDGIESHVVEATRAAILALLDNPTHTPDPDEPTAADQDLAFRKAVSS